MIILEVGYVPGGLIQCELVSQSLVWAPTPHIQAPTRPAAAHLEPYVLYLQIMLAV